VREAVVAPLGRGASHVDLYDRDRPVAQLDDFFDQQPVRALDRDQPHVELARRPLREHG
jgi:hypothetical protein